jgi:hypothetical protein
MTLAPFTENLNLLVSILVLVFDLLSTIVAVRYREKMGKLYTITFSLIAAGIAALIIISSFLEFCIDSMHVLCHSIFSLILVFCAVLLVTEGVPSILDHLVLFDLKIFDRFQYLLAQTATTVFYKLHDSLELNTFDRSQYILANLMTSFSANIKKIQSGNLSLNMIYFLIGLFFCFLLLNFSF